MSTPTSRAATNSTRWWDQLAAVIELACDTDDRSDNEQRALLRVAAKVDREREKDTTTNPDPIPPYLEDLADVTRQLYDKQRRITPPSEAKKRRKA